MKRVYQIVKQKGTAVNMAACLNIIKIWLDTISPGIYLLKLERKPSLRTISQNKLMWLWFSAIAEAWSEATGRTYISQDVHDYYCLELIPKVTPQGQRYGGSTSALTTEEMSSFLDKVQLHALENYEIDLPKPDALMFEAWADQYEQQ